jgi:hypothetical protein
MAFATPGLLLFAFRNTFFPPKGSRLALACLKCLNQLFFQHFHACAQPLVVLRNPPIFC